MGGGCRFDYGENEAVMSNCLLGLWLLWPSIRPPAYTLATTACQAPETKRWGRVEGVVWTPRRSARSKAAGTAFA